MDEMVKSVVDYIMTKGPDLMANLIYAVIIFFVGKFLARILAGFLAGIMRRSKVDDTLVGFTQNVTYAIMMVFVVISSLKKLGFDTTSLVAVLGAAGLAIGLAMQNSLSNFAAGVLLIIFRPFKVGDFIEAAGIKGVIKDIDIFTTSLDTADNARIIVPNSSITSSNIVNYSKNTTRRVDLVMSISYDDDIALAKKTIESVLENEPVVLKEPRWVIAVSELADSSVNLVVRPWVNSTDYWPAYFSLTEKLKLALEEKGLTIPFPQRDIHVIDGSNNKSQVV